MTSKHSRIDSLFVDEDFGTLDEDALDTVLSSFNNLKQQGKLIGTISHVNALRDRIRTQITVTPATGGRSKLTGTGIKAD